MNRTALKALAVCGVVALALVAWLLREVIAILLGACAIAAAIEPLARRLSGRRISRGLALGLSYAGVILVIVGTVTGVVRVLFVELGTLGTDLGAMYASARTKWQAGGFVGRVLAEHLPASLLELPKQILGGKLVSSTAVPLHVLECVGWAVILAVCWSYAGERVLTLTLSLCPSHARARCREAWRASTEAAGSVLRVTAAESLALVTLLPLALHFLGLRYAAAAAVLVTAARLLPYIGAAAALALSGLAGLIVGPWHALWAALVTAAFLLVLVPLRRRSKHAHPLAVAFVAMAFLLSWGGASVIAAPIVAAGLQALLTTLAPAPKSAAKIVSGSATPSPAA